MGVIAAMGNDTTKASNGVSAAIREVCAVGATDELDKRAPFSNTGRHIDLWRLASTCVDDADL